MQVVKLIFAIFAVAGAIDKITGNHFKLGDEFEKGILAAGTLALAMVGMICIAPTLAQLLTPVMKPLSQWTGLDPSVLGSFIATIWVVPRWHRSWLCRKFWEPLMVWW
ncbi:MAG: ethanolamine utilization protein EutH [Firmicutes bacterium]|nr:ethanolamine utilization protein EutH [Bacillota bacterium]